MDASNQSGPRSGPFNIASSYYPPKQGTLHIIIDPPTPPRARSGQTRSLLDSPSSQKSFPHQASTDCGPPMAGTEHSQPIGQLPSHSTSAPASPAPEASSLSSPSPASSSGNNTSRASASFSEFITMAPLTLLEKAVVILFLIAAVVFTFGVQDRIQEILSVQFQCLLSEITSIELSVESFLSTLKILGPAVLLSYTVDSDPRNTDATLLAAVGRCRACISQWRNQLVNCYQRCVALIQSLVEACNYVLDRIRRLPLVVRYLVAISLAVPLLRYGIAMVAQMLTAYSIEIGSAAGILTMSFGTVRLLRTKQRAAKAAASLSDALKQMLVVHQAHPSAVDGFYPASYLREEVSTYFQGKDSVENEEMRRILSKVDLQGFSVDSLWAQAATQLRKNVRIQVIEKEFHGKRQTCWRMLAV